jgi:hypothetical protein
MILGARRATTASMMGRPEATSESPSDSNGILTVPDSANVALDGSTLHDPTQRIQSSGSLKRGESFIGRSRLGSAPGQSPLVVPSAAPPRTAALTISNGNDSAESPPRSGSLLGTSFSPRPSAGGHSSPFVHKPGVRAAVISEILKTERDYVLDLALMLDIHHTSLQQRKILPPQEIDTLFSTVPPIMGISKQFLSELEKVLLKGTDYEHACVADVFLRMANFFKIYLPYFALQPMMQRILERNEQENENYIAWLAEVAQAPLARGLTFMAFHIKPAQRLLKYPLLLRELNKHTSPEHPDSERVEQALRRFEDLANQMNEAKREAEIQEKMAYLQENLRGEGGCEVPNLWGGRKLLLDDMLTTLAGSKPQPRRCLLFSDLLLVIRIDGKRLWLSAAIPLEVLKVINIADTETAQHCFSVQRTNSTEDSFVLSCHDAAVKNAWLTQAKHLVKEYQRAALRAAGPDRGSPSPMASPTVSRKTVA